MAPHLVCCQGFAADDYSLTSAELSRCPSLDAPALRDHTSDLNIYGVRLVVAKRKSRRRGSWGTLDFRSFKVRTFGMAGWGH